MEMYINMIIKGAIWIVAAVFAWKVYPLIKDNAMYKKAMQIVLLMEEEMGAGNGTIKFDTAVGLLQEWINKRGWKVDIAVIMDTITAAVGELHTAQGKEPAQKEQTDNG